MPLPYKLYRLFGLVLNQEENTEEAENNKRDHHRNNQVGPHLISVLLRGKAR